MVWVNPSRMGKEEEKVIVEIETGKRVVGFLWGLKGLQQEMEGDAKIVAISASSERDSIEKKKEGGLEFISPYPSHQAERVINKRTCTTGYN